VARRLSLSALGDRVDHWPPGAALLAGAGLGAAVVAPFALEAQPLTLIAAGCAALAGALWTAHTARPIAVPERLPPEPVPAEPPDSRDPAPLDEPLTMIELPGGSFRMGSPEDEPGRYEDEGPVHDVTVSPFALAELPITQKLYREIMGDNPGDPKGDDLPINNVTYWDAVRFCNALSEKVGLEPCYVIEKNDVEWDRSAGGYRLPTEAEWEYAARAGTTSAYFFGDDAAELGEYAWFRDNAETIHPAGKKRPSPWGFHDLYGNVWEWCWDRHAAYTANPATDPTGSTNLSSSDRVLRGGAFVSSPRSLRSASRDRFQPDFRLRFIGLRCARGSRRQPGLVP